MTREIKEYTYQAPLMNIDRKDEVIRDMMKYAIENMPMDMLKEAFKYKEERVYGMQYLSDYTIMMSIKYPMYD